MSELLLTLSTATTMASVAVTRGETVLAECSIVPAATQSDILLPVIDRLLDDLAIPLENVDLFAVVHGPGAFTGLRVGVATIKGLAISTGKPVIGVSSLHALALQAPFFSGKIYSLLDARKGEVYAGGFIWEAGVLHLADKERVIDPARLLEEVESDAIFVGDGSVVYRTLIVRQLGSRAKFAPWPANTLRAGSAAMLALSKFRESGAILPAQLNPIYIRPSDAEINILKTVADSGIEG